MIEAVYTAPPPFPSTFLRLQELGGRRLYRRVDIDQEDWPSIEGWMEGLLERVAELELRTEMDYLDLSAAGDETGHSRTRPFMAPMTVSAECIRRWS